LLFICGRRASAAIARSALAVLGVEQGRVIEVVHWDRPKLLEAFGLAMSFPSSRGFNQDELNAKEVR
jgi:hypothetical protein